MTSSTNVPVLSSSDQVYVHCNECTFKCVVALASQIRSFNLISSANFSLMSVIGCMLN